MREITKNVVDKLYHTEKRGWGEQKITDEYGIKYYVGNICEVILMKKHPTTDYMSSIKHTIFPMIRGSRRVSKSEFSEELYELLKYIS